MSQYFSEKFKQLRRAGNLTQEQIADIFHVSPQTVSRWETGVNYPEVETLPHLAVFFNVTVDELLGTEEIRGEEKANEYIRDIRNLLNSGKIQDAIELARGAGKEYPLNSDFQYHLIQALHADGSEKHKDEITSIGERIINMNSHNWGIKYQLVRQYAEWGMKAEAKEILVTLPAEIWDSQEPWWGLVLEGEEWLKNQQHRIIRAKYYLEYLIGDYINSADLGILQRLEDKKAKMQIEMLIDTISGEKIEPISRVFEHIGVAELYCEAGDAENALGCVEKATQDSMNHIAQMNKTNDIDGGNYMAWSTPRNLPWILWEDFLTKPSFDLLRGEKRFVKCVDLLKASSAPLE